MTAIALALLLLVGADTDIRLLPQRSFMERWKPEANPRIFREADLYGYINGGAEIFLEFGFEQLTVAAYGAEGGREIQVELYRMTDPTAAEGVYRLKCGHESSVPELKARHTINRYQLLFQRHRYFGIINNGQGDEELREAMIAFAAHVIDRLPEDPPAGVIGLMPREGLDPGSIRLIRGPYALQSIYTLGEGDILRLRPGVTAVAGNYRSPALPRTLIAAEYADGPSAQAAMTHAIANLDSYLSVLEKGPEGIVFRDHAGQFGRLRLEGRRLTVEVHLRQRPPLR